MMQYICLSICTLLEDEEKTQVDANLLERAYKFTTMNFNYADVVNVYPKVQTREGSKESYIKQ